VCIFLQTRYIKKNEGIPTPKNLIKDEAQRLGVINHDATVVLESRPVPKDPLEAVKARVAYRAAMNATRSAGTSIIINLTPTILLSNWRMVHCASHPFFLLLQFLLCAGRS
jgi:hypothetical protein